MKFTKMQAAGNDFIIVDAKNLNHDWAVLSKIMCDRHFGVGADGLILVQEDAKSVLSMRIFNADGSEAEMCGNGIRCFAIYALKNKLVSGHEINIRTLAGMKTVYVKITKNAREVKVNMGAPVLKPKDIPAIVQLNKEELDIKSIIDYPLVIGSQRLFLSFVSMGNPHAVAFIKSPVSEFPLTDIGPKVENSKIFPKKTNFEIARVIGKNGIEARVWERGVGETLACGTGACAVGVAAKLKGYMDHQVDIIMPGGTLNIAWDGKNEVFLTGGAEQVFVGQWKV